MAHFPIPPTQYPSAFRRAVLDGKQNVGKESCQPARCKKIFGFPYASFLHILRDYENGQDYERLLAQVLVATQKTPTDRHVDQRYRVYLEISKLCGLRFFTIPLELKNLGHY